MKRPPAPAQKSRVKTLSVNDVRQIVFDVLKENNLHSVQEIASKAAEAAVHQTLLTMGVDTSNPLKAQETFAALKNIVNLFNEPEMGADLAHLRAWRQTTQGMKSKAMMTVVGLGITTIVALLANTLGLKIQWGG